MHDGTDTRVLVIGAGGFVGSRLIGALLARGADVHGVIRPRSGPRGPAPVHLEPGQADVPLHAIDATDAESLARTVEAVGPAVLVSLVKSGRAELAADPARALRTNFLAALSPVVAAAAGGGCPRVVHFGSSTEYEPRPEPLREAGALRPVSLHGAGKAAGTLAALRLADELGIGLTVLRPFGIYGPGDDPRHLIPTAIAAARTGTPLPVSPRGRRDWVYVDDVVAAGVTASLDRALHAVEINIATGTQSTNLEVVRTVADAVGSPIDIRLQPDLARPWDRDDWRADISRAADLLDWRPRVPLAQGVAETVAWELTHAG